MDVVPALVRKEEPLILQVCDSPAAVALLRRVEAVGYRRVDDHCLEHRPQLAVGCEEAAVDEGVHGLPVAVRRDDQPKPREVGLQRGDFPAQRDLRLVQRQKPNSGQGFGIIC